MYDLIFSIYPLDMHFHNFCLFIYVIIWTIYVTLFLIIKEKDVEILKQSTPMQLQEICTHFDCLKELGLSHIISGFYWNSENWVKWFQLKHSIWLFSVLQTQANSLHLISVLSFFDPLCTGCTCFSLKFSKHTSVLTEQLTQKPITFNFKI
jgi:hypothetical protein